MAAEISQLSEVQRSLLAWHSANGLRAPWRETRDPYHVLVAAVMAQQTQMSRVMGSYERFLTAFPTLESLAAAPAGDVIRAWTGMGYNQRAARLHRAAREIAERGWPHDAAQLANIHGVGPFTAAIIASFAFGRPAACVDTNVRRVLGRLAGEEKLAPRDLQRLADASLATHDPARWNQAVMDYGATICTPRPKCDICIVARCCASRGRFASPMMVAEERVPYAAASSPRQRRAPYERSARYYRGRIVDALRAMSPGDSLPVAALPQAIGNGGSSPSLEETRTLVDALVRDGLAVVTETPEGERIALP